MIKQYMTTLAVGVSALMISFGSGIQQTRAAGNFDGEGLNSIKQLKTFGARIGYHKRTGKVNFIGFGPDQSLTAPGMFAGATAQENAQAALAQFAPMFGVQNPATDLREMKQFTSADGRSMVRYQQLHQGIPVIGGELIVNMNAQGQLVSMNGEAFADAISNMQATVPASDARQKALEFVAIHHSVAISSLDSTNPVLSIYAPELIGPSSMPPMLVWKTEISSTNNEPINEFVLVHAQRGNIALHFNQVHTAKNRNTYDGSAVVVPSDLPGTLLCNESSGDTCTGGTDADADAAHIYAGDTYDFYLTYHGRDSIDGSGMALTSTVNFNVLGICPNAFWYPPDNQMIYCAGFPLADDVVAHEFTHGITDRTSKLFYYYQSGAINESLSDVWGEFIDQNNGRGTDDDLLPPAGVKWLLGEDLPITIGPIRSMSDPTLFGDPDRMTSTNYYTSLLDQGGVHYNSGVNNKAAYLMVDGSVGEPGGMFNGYTISAMGIPKVARIYYEVQTRLLTSGSDYLDLYNALYQGCLNLVGTNNITNSDCDNVREATLAVEMDQEPSTGFNPEASLCPTGQAPSNLFYDDFEQGIGKWTIGGPIGATTSVWTQDSPDGPYAASGKHSLYADDSVGSNHTYATMTTGVTIPSGGLQFHFNQAFGFGAPGQGGGHVQYSINGGTFQDAQPLYAAGQDYNGLIQAGPTSGTNGFIDSSHGYVSSRYEITTNVGNTIKFRFDLGTASVPDSGWWIDDVRLYTCIPNTPPTAPELVSPADTATDVNSAGVEFKWKSSTDDDNDVISYTLEVCNDSGFTSCATTVTKSNAAAPFVSAGVGGGAGLLLVSLLFAGRHRRIAAVALIFSVSLMLSSCGGGSKAQPVYVTYFDNTLSPGMTYYWRVTADDGNGGSAPSVQRSFTTAP